MSDGDGDDKQLQYVLSQMTAYKYALPFKNPLKKPVMSGSGSALATFMWATTVACVIVVVVSTLIRLAICTEFELPDGSVVPRAVVFIELLLVLATMVAMRLAYSHLLA